MSNVIYPDDQTPDIGLIEGLKAGGANVLFKPDYLSVNTEEMKPAYLPSSIERIIEAATLAPSSHNTQPWKFTVKGNAIHILPDFNRSLPISDPYTRELFISLGCALENMTLCARHEGFSVTPELFPDGSDEIVARLTPMLFPPDSEKEALFEAIENRQSTRNFYDGQLLPQEVIDTLSEMALDEGVHLLILSDRQSLDHAATLVRKAGEYLLAKESYRRELLDWTRFSRRNAERRRDGISSRSVGRKWLPDWLGRFLLNHWIRPDKLALEEEKLIHSASGMLLFYTIENDPVSWVRLGRSFERIALTLTHLGLKHAPHNQPCEVPAFRQQFRRAFGPEIAFPQLLVRIGYSEAMPLTLRRSLEEVMV